MDYPPTISYFTYFWGKVFEILLPESIIPIKSWGYESVYQKLLMRLTVLISDIVIFHIPLYFVLSTIYKETINKSNNSSIYSKLKYNIVLLLVLICPVLNLIDHGHFQYNCVMFGLYLWAVYFCYIDYTSLAIFFIALSINFKQMALYYALPFAFYVIGKLFQKTTNYNFCKRIIVISFYTLVYGAITILSIFIIWSPWILSHTHDDVLKRIFPIWRGIFEDKVKHNNI